MTLRFRWTTIFLLIAVCLLGHLPACFAIEDAIIAVVNDELITLKDLKDYAQSTYASLVAQGVDESQIQSIMSRMDEEGLNKIIEDKLILSRANNVGLEVREELVDQRIDELEKRYGSEQNLVDALVRTGATVTDLKNKIRNDMKIKFIVDHEVKDKIYVNPQEITDYYEANKEKFGKKTRVNLGSIFIEYNGDKAAAHEKANKALLQIRNEKNFQEVSEKFSDAPSVGIVEQGSLLSSIEETISKLNIDEVSDLVETDNGIYIFKLIGRIPAQIPKLEEVRSTVYDMLYKEKFKTRLTGWIDELKKEAYIEIK